MTDSYQSALAKQAAAKERKEKRAEKSKTLWAKGGKPRKKKSPTLSKLKKILWSELREVVYSQSPICVICGSDSPPVACHIVPSHEGAMTRFFLPNIYRGCGPCNYAENNRRGHWVKLHESKFGVDFVDALFAMSQETFQIKKHWVLEQIERMKKLRGNPTK